MENAVEVKAQKRPLWVGIICVYYFLTTGYTLTKLTLVSSGLVELDPVQKSYWAGVTPGEYLLGAVSACVILGAAISLFWMRRVAFPLFCVALALTMSITIWRALTSNWISAVGIQSLMGFGFGWTTMLLACVYTRHLRAQGILK